MRSHGESGPASGLKTRSDLIFPLPHKGAPPIMNTPELVMDTYEIFSIQGRTRKPVGLLLNVQSLQGKYSSRDQPSNNSFTARYA